MKLLHHSPTVNLSDVFGNFIIINDSLKEYAKHFTLFHIKMFDADGNMKKVSCNLPALIDYLFKNDAPTIYVYGVSHNRYKLLIEQEKELFVIFYDV